MERTSTIQTVRAKPITAVAAKIIVLSCMDLILLLGSVLAVANWLAEKGVVEKANWVREEFLTGTAIAVIVALLILLVNPKSGRVVGLGRRCPVCDKRLFGDPKYCGECGSKVA